MEKESGKTASTNPIAADLVITVNENIHERIIKKEQQDGLHELAPKKGKDRSRRSCPKFLHVKVLNLVWELV